MKRFVLFFALSVFCAAAFAAADPLPTPQEFHGYPLGARFTSHERVVAYFDALDAHSELITVERYGESSEGRPLVYAVITSPENRNRLAELRAAVAELNRSSPLGSSPLGSDARFKLSYLALVSERSNNSE